MNWTTEKPTEPGLYHWCDGVSEHVSGVLVARRLQGLEFCTDTSPGLRSLDWALHGYWRSVETPAAFVKPVPPDLKPDEIFTAMSPSYPNELRWIYRFGEAYIVRDGHGRICNGYNAISRKEVDGRYSNLQRIG